MMASKTFEDMDISFNADGWGPVSGDKSLVLHGVPYAHFDKKERTYRMADFTSQQFQQSQYQQQRQYRHRRDENQGASEFAYKYDAAEDSTFQLVDSTKTTTKKFTGGTTTK